MVLWVVARGFQWCYGWLLGVFYSDIGVCYGISRMCCVVVRGFLWCCRWLLGGFCGALGGCLGIAYWHLLKYNWWLLWVS